MGALDAEAVADKAVPHVFQKAGDPVVPAGAAARGDFNQTEIDVKIIIECGDRNRRHFVIAGQGPDGPAAFVHERQRLCEITGRLPGALPAGALRLELRLDFPRPILLARNLENLEKIAEKIRAGGGACTTLSCDVTRADEVDRADA